MNAVGQPGYIDQIKQANAGGVYRLIDQLAPISRIELSKRAHLAPASITKIVRELLEVHLVKEVECQDISNRGRPAIGLALAPEAWHYLSARISRGTLTLSLRDLSSKLVVEEHLPLAAGHCDPLLKRILCAVDQFFIRHQSKLERLTAIAITLLGTIDVASGVVHHMPFYPVRDMPLGPSLEAHIGLPVYLQHDISAWTMAEALFGAARGSQNVIQIVIDHHVGAGIITGGHVLHTGRHSLVEIGHIQVDPYGKRCYCGNYGCLETVASIENLLEIAQQRLGASMNSSLHRLPLTIESLCDAALAGDHLAQDIIFGVGYSLGGILAMMVNLFNPEKILLGSPLNRAAEILHPAIASCIRQRSLPAYSEQVQVGATQFSNQGTMPGAALVKEALYNGSLLV